MTKRVTPNPVRFKPGDTVAFTSRADKGKAKFVRYEDSQRGEWVVIALKDGSERALRPSQIKRG